jgi:hypothetical protein
VLNRFRLGHAGAADWRTVHVVDVENLIGEDHRIATVEQIRAVIEDYRQLVGARDGDLFFFGANPELKFRVMVATGSNQVRGYKGKDGADKALLDVVGTDWVVGQFDRVCVASGDHAFAPLARSLHASEIGDEIPEALYEGVAAIVRFLTDGGDADRYDPAPDP